MKRFKINPAGNLFYGMKGSSHVMFSLASSPKHGSKQIRQFDSCRDYINDCVIAAASYKETGGKRPSMSWSPKRNAPVDFNNLRLLIYKEPFTPRHPSTSTAPLDAAGTEMRVFDAKKVVNLYEEFAGFHRRSKIRRVDHVEHGWILIGPSQWMKSTHLISMVSLIFRVVILYGGFHDCETLDQVEDRFKWLCNNKTARASGYSLNNDLVRSLPRAWPKFRILMDQYEYIFGRRPKSFWHPSKSVNSWHGQGGIYSLCSGNVRQDMKTLMAKAKERYNQKNRK